MEQVFDQTAKEFMQTLLRLAGGELTVPVRASQNRRGTKMDLGVILTGENAESLGNSAKKIIALVNGLQSGDSPIEFSNFRTRMGTHVSLHLYPSMMIAVLDRLRVYGPSLLEMMNTWNTHQFRKTVSEPSPS